MKKGLKTMQKLKKGQESFTVMDGPYEGKTFEKDVEYDEVPENEKHRFESVKFNEPGPAKVNGKKSKGGK
jgi:hypothetical protein